MKAHDIPDAIQWHEGLLLTPQHFQQLSSRHEALVQYGTSVVAPFCWGVRRFRHDAISLTEGKLEVKELEAVMPDGLVVSHVVDTSEGSHPLAVNLSGYELADKALTVYLAVAATQAGGSNGGVQRYVPFKGPPVPDEVGGGNPREIGRLKPQLHLLVDSLPPKYIGFPLAKVIQMGSSFAMDPDFVPPLLGLPVISAVGGPPTGAAQRLGDMCSKTATEVRKRAKHLAKAHLSNSSNAVERSGVETRYLMFSLVGALPQLEAVLKISSAHPFTIYLALCAMAGHLAVLTTKMIPDSFAAYNHDDLYTSFKLVLNYINSSLAEGVPLGYKSIPFLFEASDEAGGKGVFELRFDGAWMNKRLAIGMKGPRGMAESDVVKWGENCLIGSKSKIKSIGDKRTTGALRKRVDRIMAVKEGSQSASDIVPADGVVLFSLTAEDAIEPDKFLQIVNPDGSRPAEIILHVMDN
jgi:type VI secretion system protein ImpJ